MASNFKSGGTDLDSIFKARITSKISDVQYDVNGVDISNRYEGYRTFATKVSDTDYDYNVLAVPRDLANGFLGIDVPIVDGSDFPSGMPSTVAHEPTSGSASAYVYFNTFGSLTLHDGSDDNSKQWLDITGTGNGLNHYCRYILNSGDTPTYLQNISTSWSAVSGHFALGFQNQTDKECNVTIEIAENASGTNKKSWTVTFRARTQTQVLWTSTAGSAMSSAIEQAPGNVVLSWLSGLTMTVTANNSSNLTSPYASGGTGSDFQIKWDLVSTSGVGAAVTPVSFNEDTWYTCDATRQLQFSGNQSAPTTRIVTVDVTIRKNGDASSEVTKRITVTTIHEI